MSPKAPPSTPAAVDVAGVARDFVAALRAAADPARARPMAAYMRDRFAFLGVATPERRVRTRAGIAALKRSRDGVAAAAVAGLLWRQPWRECQYVGVDLLAACAKSLPEAALPEIERLIVTHSWWDTVDALAKHTVGALVRNHAQAVATMDRWATDPNPWLRRAAILHQLGFKQATDADRLFRYCVVNAEDPDFFLRKGIGWALREYAYVEPARVAEFLREHRAQLSPLSLREAGKHLEDHR